MLKVARTPAEFQDIWETLQSGDEVHVVNCVFPGEFTLANKVLLDYADVWFDNCLFPGVSVARNLPSVWLNKLSHVRFHGGSVSGPLSGTGILAYDCDHVSWWDYKVDNVGGHGVALMGITKACDSLDFRGEVSHWGQNLAWDPHATKGTGLHGILVADSSYGIRNSTIRIHAHDSKCGSAAEIGGSKSSDGVWNCDILAITHDLAHPANYPSGDQTCANGLQIWGDNVLNSKLAVKAWNLAGVPVHYGMWSGQSLATDTITIL